MSSITSMLTVMLGGIAAISLVVGGIGIMNIMMVTVTERTREIGIRKAIGASRGTILTQFLMEAVVLCMMGCCLGIFLSWAILQIVNTVVVSLDMRFTLNVSVVMIAVAFCFLIGIVFGLYPANKAVKIPALEAIRGSFGYRLIMIVFKLLMLPVVVSIAYEINRWVGKTDNAFTRLLTAPGLWMQNFTTNEPDDSMIEVAITAVNAVLPEQEGADEW